MRYNYFNAIVYLFILLYAHRLHPYSQKDSAPTTHPKLSSYLSVCLSQNICKLISIQDQFHCNTLDMTHNATDKLLYTTTRLGWIPLNCLELDKLTSEACTHNPTTSTRSFFIILTITLMPCLQCTTHLCTELWIILVTEISTGYRQHGWMSR